MSAQGSDFQEELLVGFLNSDHEMHHKYGASSIARTCTSARSKGAIGKLGGAQRLVVLLKRYVRNGQASNHGTESNQTVLALLNAVLNMTTYGRNQEIVGKTGAGFISELATRDHAADIQGFAARILKNLARNPANRSRLYKAELRLKAEQWHREACDPANPDAARELEENIAQAGLWHSVKKRGGLPNVLDPDPDTAPPLPFATHDDATSLSRRSSRVSYVHNKSRSRITRPSSAAATYRSSAKPPVEVDKLLRGAAALAVQRRDTDLHHEAGQFTPTGLSMAAIVPPVLAKEAVRRMRQAVQQSESELRKRSQRAGHQPPEKTVELQHSFMAWYDSLKYDEEVGLDTPSPSGCTSRRRSALSRTTPKSVAASINTRGTGLGKTSGRSNRPGRRVARPQSAAARRQPGTSRFQRQPGSAGHTPALRNARGSRTLIRRPGSAAARVRARSASRGSRTGLGHISQSRRTPSPVTGGLPSDIATIAVGTPNTATILDNLAMNLPGDSEYVWVGGGISACF